MPSILQFTYNTDLLHFRSRDVGNEMAVIVDKTFCVCAPHFPCASTDIHKMFVWVA